MDGCLLCLEINKEFGDCIKVDSEQWQEHNIKILIEKHLWIMESISTSSWLCQACWQSLYDFHKFYLRIEEAHMDFGKLVKKLKPESRAQRTDCTDDDDDDKNDLFESHLEPEILVMEDNKTIIKQEPNEDLEEDNVPLSQRRKRRRNSKDGTNDNETPKEDPLKNSKQTKKSSKSKSKKKDPASIPANTSKTEIQTLKEDPDKIEKPETEKLKADPDTLENLDISNVSLNSSDCDDFDLNTDFDYKSEEEGEEEIKQTKKTTKKKTRRKKSISASEESISEDFNTDSDYELAESKPKKPKQTKKKKKTRKNKNNSDDTDSDNKSDEDTNKEPKRSAEDRDKFLAENFKMTCALCDIVMPTFRALYKHFQTEHKEKKGYAVCCQKKFYDRCKLFEHVERHVDPDNFKCNECGKELSSRKTLQIHQLSHLPDEEKKFTCTKCGKNFTEESALIIHNNELHLKKFMKICDICGKKLRCRKAFQRHMLGHEGKSLPSAKCDICGLYLSNKDGLARHKRMQHPVDGKKEYICNICFKVSPNKHSLRMHISDNHPTKMHKCTMCNRVFKKSIFLKEHMATHTGIPLYTCTWCPKTFNAGANLHVHRKTQHPAEYEECRKQKHLEKYKTLENMDLSNDVGKMHQCTMCEKSFKRPLHLKEHMSTHTGVALYTCPWCPKTFNTNGGWHSHRKRQHPVEHEAARRQKHLESYKAVDIIDNTADLAKFNAN